MKILLIKYKSELQLHSHLFNLVKVFFSIFSGFIRFLAKTPDTIPTNPLKKPALMKGDKTCLDSLLTPLKKQLRI